MLHLQNLNELSEARKSKWRPIRCALGTKYQREDLRCFWFHAELGGLFATDGSRIHFVPATIEDEKMWGRGYNPLMPFNDYSMIEIHKCLHTDDINQITLSDNDFSVIHKLLKESDAIEDKFKQDKKLAETKLYSFRRGHNKTAELKAEYEKLQDAYNVNYKWGCADNLIRITLGGINCSFVAKHFANAMSVVSKAKTVKIMFRDRIRQITITADDGRFAILINSEFHEKYEGKHTVLGGDAVVAAPDYGLITDRVKAIAEEPAYDEDQESCP